jgi:beta-phosphoglucomutase-like phosphatase (HAD superfamily)
VRKPQLVIFDCDGVLVDSETISNTVLARSLSRDGLPTTPAEARRDYQGLPMADVVSQAQRKLGRPLTQGWLTRFERDLTAAFRRELRPMPGAAEAVESVRRAGVAVCVASQRKREKARLCDEAALRRAGAEVLRSLAELPALLGLE